VNHAGPQWADLQYFDIDERWLNKQERTEKLWDCAREHAGLNIGRSYLFRHLTVDAFITIHHHEAQLVMLSAPLIFPWLFGCFSSRPVTSVVRYARLAKHAQIYTAEEITV
jgi:hypothetical protein